MSIEIKQTYRAKPTNPTNHPPIILNNIDIFTPKMYVVGYYFFKNVDNKKEFMDPHKLFSSLEDILSDYYPLAGRLKIEPDGGMSILYSDQGIPFVMAESSDITIKQLEEKNWENDSIPKGLLPVDYKSNPNDGPLLILQLTMLTDGSVLGAAIHHSATDGNSALSFFDNWGRKARKEPFTLPVHDRSLLKASGNPPSREHPEFMVLNLLSNTIKNYTNLKVQLPQIVKKIFYFSKENLKKLYDAYSSDDSTDSRVSINDALSAHICRTTARARGIPLDEQVVCAIAVDIRKKLNPPLPPSYFGNAGLPGHPRILVSELINGPRSKVALNVQKGHTEMNDSKIRSILDWLEQQPNKSHIATNVDYNKDFFITNLFRFPIYSLDFGYGTPIRYRTPSEALYPGFAMLIGTPADDGGVDVYINLSPEHMQNLEQDPEFRMFQ